MSILKKSAKMRAPLLLEQAQNGITVAESQRGDMCNQQPIVFNSKADLYDYLGRYFDENEGFTEE